MRAWVRKEVVGRGDAGEGERRGGGRRGRKRGGEVVSLGRELEGR